MERFVSPVLDSLQDAPAFSLLNNPLLVPAYNVDGVNGSTVSVDIRKPGSPLLIALQEAPPFSLLNNPLLVPA